MQVTTKALPVLKQYDHMHLKASKAEERAQNAEAATRAAQKKLSASLESVTRAMAASSAREEANAAKRAAEKMKSHMAITKEREATAEAIKKSVELERQLRIAERRAEREKIDKLEGKEREKKFEEKIQLLQSMKAEERQKTLAEVSALQKSLAETNIKLKELRTAPPPQRPPDPTPVIIHVEKSAEPTVSDESERLAAEARALAIEAEAEADLGDNYDGEVKPGNDLALNFPLFPLPSFLNSKKKTKKKSSKERKALLARAKAAEAAAEAAIAAARAEVEILVGMENEEKEERKMRKEKRAARKKAQEVKLQSSKFTQSSNAGTQTDEESFSEDESALAVHRDTVVVVGRSQLTWFLLSKHLRSLVKFQARIRGCIDRCWGIYSADAMPALDEGLSEELLRKRGLLHMVLVRRRRIIVHHRLRLAREHASRYGSLLDQLTKEQREERERRKQADFERAETNRKLMEKERESLLEEQRVMEFEMIMKGVDVALPKPLRDR